MDLKSDGGEAEEQE